MEKAGDAQALSAFIAEHPEVMLLQAHDEVQREISQLNRLAVTTIGDRETLKSVDAARQSLMRGLNGIIKGREEAGTAPTLAQKIKNRTAGKVLVAAE